VYAGLNIKNPTFYQQCIYVNIYLYIYIYIYVAYVSERIAIISLYTINVFVFITVREPAFCAVRTGVLNTV